MPFITRRRADRADSSNRFRVDAKLSMYRRESFRLFRGPGTALLVFPANRFADSSKPIRRTYTVGSLIAPSESPGECLNLPTEN